MEKYESKFVKNGDVSIHYVEAGPSDGPLVVLLHGFPSFWYTWRHQIDPLADAGFHVIAPDMRGYNLSSKPKELEAYSWQPVLSDVTALLDHVGGHASKAVLAGHDWGGAVAWRYAQEHPERVRGLAALNIPELHSFHHAVTSNLGQMARSWYIYVFQQPDIPESVLSANDWAFLRYTIQNDGEKKQSEEYAQQHVDALAKPGALTATLNYYRNLLHNWGMEEKKRLEVPVLYLWGDKEKYFEPELAEVPRDLVPDVKVVHFPEASHWVLWDAAEEVTSHIIDFVKQVHNK